MGMPEFRTTPAGTAVLRMTVQCADQPGALELPVVLIGEKAEPMRTSLRNGVMVKVDGTLKPIRRRLKSGIFEEGFEVIADSIVIEGSEKAF